MFGASALIYSHTPNWSSTKYLRIIYLQGIFTSEGYKGTFISHCHDEHDSYAELNLKEDKPGWHKEEPFERVYVKYNPKKTFQLMKLLYLTIDIKRSRHC